MRSADPFQPDAYPEHLEAGTVNAQGLAGLAAALGFISETGVDRIAAHETALRARFVERVRGLDGFRVLGGSDGHDHTGVVALDVAGEDSSRVADRLAFEFGVATRAGLHCAPRMHAALGTLGRGAVRFSFGWFTTEDDVDAAADALAPDFPQAPKMLLPMYIALLEQSGMPDRREQPACAAALEYLFHRLSGRKVDLRRIAAKNGVSPRLCRMMAKRILRAVKNMVKNKTKGSAEHEVHQL